MDIQGITLTAVDQGLQMILYALVSIVAALVVKYAKKFAGITFDAKQIVQMANANALADRLAENAVHAVKDKWDNLEQDKKVEYYTDKLTHATDTLRGYLKEAGISVTFNDAELEDKIRAAYQRVLKSLGVWTELKVSQADEKEAV